MSTMSLSAMEVSRRPPSDGKAELSLVTLPINNLSVLTRLRFMYIVFNGSEKHEIVVRQPGGREMWISPGKIAPLRTDNEELGIISVEFGHVGGRIAPLRVDSLGLRVSIVRTPEGLPLGSVAIQTVLGSRDSRLVVKLGEVQFGSLRKTDRRSKPTKMFQDDFIRFRMQWSELRVTLNEARAITDKHHAIAEMKLDKFQQLGRHSAHSEVQEVKQENSIPRSWRGARSGSKQAP